MSIVAHWVGSDSNILWRGSKSHAFRPTHSSGLTEALSMPLHSPADAEAAKTDAAAERMQAVSIDAFESIGVLFGFARIDGDMVDAGIKKRLSPVQTIAVSAVSSRSCPGGWQMKSSEFHAERTDP
ncbi:hypothetical protein [Methylobacterium fujisawaense]